MVGDAMVAVALLARFKPMMRAAEDLRAQKRPKTDKWVNPQVEPVLLITYIR